MEKKAFCSCFHIIMSSPAPSNISQNNAEILKEQRYEMQRQHEEQQSLLHLQEAAEACRTEYAA